MHSIIVPMTMGIGAIAENRKVVFSSRRFEILAMPLVRTA
jgi:hypothetical protein